MAKKIKTVKRWSRAMVVYNGGVSMTTRGVKFLRGRAKPITDRKLATYLATKKHFSVQDEFVEVEAEPEPETTTTKTRRTRKTKED